MGKEIGSDLSKVNKITITPMSLSENESRNLEFQCEQLLIQIQTPCMSLDFMSCDFKVN